jgi:hypothetical protein
MPGVMRFAGNVMLSTHGMGAQQLLMDRAPSHVVSVAPPAGCDAGASSVLVLPPLHELCCARRSCTTRSHP